MAQGNGEKIPISLQLADRLIDGAIVKPITFSMYSDCWTEAQGMSQPKAFDARVRRVRMLKQVDYFVNGSVTKLTVEELLRMPIPAFHAIGAVLDTEDEETGKIIRPGDGISQAITYQLGKPISLGQGKDPISELEFLAKTYGEIEDVLSAGHGLAQASILISTVAKPLGTSLTALPSWAITQISLSDGVTIMREVLPHFLGLPVES